MKLTETIIRDLDFGEECWVKGEFKAGQMDFPAEVVLGGRNMEIVDAEKAVVVEKVEIPQYVADWVEQKKSKGDLEELLDIAVYCNDEKVLNWYDSLANYELADEILVKAYIIGYEVKESLGVLLLDISEFGYYKYNYLYKRDNGKFTVDCTDETDIFVEYAHKVTEAEAKENYPNFKWVSLEELGE